MRKYTILLICIIFIMLGTILLDLTTLKAFPFCLICLGAFGILVLPLLTENKL